jgi:tetratricopeptide (TPR) repeat protein
MKRLSLLLTLGIFCIQSLFAQISPEEKNELYPDQYTFEKAEAYQNQGEYEKALWFYINLFPDNKAQVVDLVKALATKLDTVNMSLLIKKSFTLYGTFDPEISTFKDGAPILNLEKLKTKGAWGDELIQKISDPEQALSSGSEYNFRALDKVKAGDLQGALNDFDKAIELKPTAQIYFNRAYTKSLLEDYRGAIEDYNKTIEQEYRLAQALFERGYCKQQLEMNDEAIDDYSKAIKTDKNSFNAYNNRGVIYIIKKDYKAALKDLDQAIRIKPDFVSAYVSRGFARYESKNTKGACADWQKAKELGFEQADQILLEHCK